MRVKRETAVKATKSLYTGTGAATAAALLVAHFAPTLDATQSGLVIGAIAGGIGTAWRLFVGILESRFGLAKYL
jgi:hypothetical protein